MFNTHRFLACKLLIVAFVSTLLPTQVLAARDVLTLDNDCVVTILNRTVQADESGNFSMPNVPASMGPR